MSKAKRGQKSGGSGNKKRAKMNEKNSPPVASSSNDSNQQEEEQTIRKTRSSQKKVTPVPGSAEAHAKEKQAQALIYNAPRKKSISVGQNFQAPILMEATPGMPDPTSEEYPGRKVEDCLWNPHLTDLDDDKIHRYCYEANTQFGIDPDRALYILYKSDFDLKKARQELPKRTIFREGFSDDDAQTFKNGFIHFGKNFNKIKQMLPHKTMSDLIEHYYLTKKQQNYKSYIDGSEKKREETSESEDDEAEEDALADGLEPVCDVCEEEVRKVYPVNGLELCQTCKLYFKATNKHRFCHRQIAEPRRRIPKCPADMQQIADQFAEMGRLWKPTFEDTDETGELQVAKKGRTVCQQQNIKLRNEQKQLEATTRRLFASLQRKSAAITGPEAPYAHTPAEAIAFLAQTADTINSSVISGDNGNTNGGGNNNGSAKRANYSWSKREKQAAEYALIRFNGDWNLAAEILATKTPDMVKAYFKDNEQRIQKTIDEELAELEARGFPLRSQQQNVMKPPENEEAGPELIELD